MQRVTIGVPVYNAESLLEQCLESIRAQTYRDIKVVVLDNASTDSTQAIAESFAKRDSRFFYHRQPYNKGVRANFSDLLAMADTPYFLWRAYDDLSDENFVAATVKLLDENPHADLAVTRIVSQKPHGDRVRRFRHKLPFEPAIVYRIRLLFQSSASWTYAVFRTDALKESFANVQARFVHLIGADHLTIFPFLASGRVVGTNQVTFVQRYIPRIGKPDRHPLRDPHEMQAVRSDFFRYCVDSLPEVSSGVIERAMMRPALWFYSGRAYRLPKILSAHIRMWMGEKPKVSASGVGYGDYLSKPPE